MQLLQVESHADQFKARLQARCDDRATEHRHGGITQYDAAPEIASTKVWALVLYIALAGGLFATMARGFGWL